MAAVGSTPFCWGSHGDVLDARTHPSEPEISWAVASLKDQTTVQANMIAVPEANRNKFMIATSDWGESNQGIEPEDDRQPGYRILCDQNFRQSLYYQKGLPTFPILPFRPRWDSAR